MAVAGSTAPSEIGSEAPGVLLLHHFGGSGRTWREVVARLSPYPCLAPDLRGFGDSPSVQGAGYSTRENVDDLEVVRERLGTPRFLLVGHSMGGKIAIAFAARRPAGLLAVVLVSPSPPFPEPMTEEARSSLLATYGDPVAAAATNRRIAGPRLDAAGLSLLVDDNLRAARPAFRAWLEEGSREDISEALASISVPVFIMGGDLDTTLPLSLLDTPLLRKLAKSPWLSLSGVGHLAPLEAPEAVAGAIRSRLEALPS